jgi:hypothetical protein
VQQKGSVEFHVGLKPPVRLAFAEEAKRGSFNTPGEVVKLPVAAARVELVSGSGQYIRAWIAHPIDSVSESHEALTLIQLGAKDSFGTLRTADFEDHLERRAGRAAMERTLEGAHRASDSGNDIGLSGNNDSCGKRGCVQAVIADGIEIRLDRTGALRRWEDTSYLVEVMGSMR